MFSEREKSGKEDSRPRTEGKAELILGAVLRQALSLVSSRKCRAAEELEWMSRAVRETARSLGREDPTGIAVKKVDQEALDQCLTATIPSCSSSS